jgi:hypothetical protein
MTILGATILILIVIAVLNGTLVVLFGYVWLVENRQARKARAHDEPIFSGVSSASRRPLVSASPGAFSKSAHR